MSTNTALDQIKARAKKATPGPWHRPLNTRWKNAVTGIMPKGDPASTLINNTDHEGNPERITIVTAPTWSSGGFFRKQSGKDLEFIAHARTDVPKLLAALEAVEEVTQHLEATYPSGGIWSAKFRKAIEEALR